MSVAWRAGDGPPTSSLRAFSRESVATTPGLGRPPVSDSSSHTTGLALSAAKAFFGDPAQWNPETLMLAALGQCHVLSFLRAAGMRGFDVAWTSVDVSGELTLSPDGSGRFTLIEIQPATLIPRLDARAHAEEYRQLHSQAHKWCFIANSTACKILVHPDSGADNIGAAVSSE